MISYVMKNADFVMKIVRHYLLTICFQRCQFSGNFLISGNFARNFLISGNFARNFLISGNFARNFLISGNFARNFLISGNFARNFLISGNFTRNFLISGNFARNFLISGNFTRNFLILGNFTLYKRIGKYAVPGNFPSISGNFDRSDLHLCVFCFFGISLSMPHHQDFYLWYDQAKSV